MESAVRAAVMGAVIGATTGAARRGAASFRKLNFYEPIPARMAPSEALDAWVVWAKHVRAGRGPESLGDTRAAHWTYTSHEAAFGRANLERELRPPLSGAFQNPLADGAGAIGRAPVWGLIFHGDPQRAVNFACADAGADHAGEAVRGAAAVAAMTAIAGCGTTPSALLRASRPLLAPGSASAVVLAAVVRGVSDGKDAPAIFETLPPLLPTHDPHHCALNLGHLFVGLLLGEGRFDPTVRIVAGCGGEANQTTLAAGALAALMEGAAPDEWTAPLGDAYLAGHGLRDIDPPSTLDELVAQILSACEAGGAAFAPGPAAAQAAFDFAAAAGEPAPPPDAPQEEATRSTGVTHAAEPVVALEAPQGDASEPAPAPVAIPEWAEAGDAMLAALGGAVVRVQYLDPPVLAAGKAVRMVLAFENPAGPEGVFEPKLTHPGGWTVAHKLTSFRLREGESTQFPLVVQAPAGASAGRLEVASGRDRVRLPLLAPERWYWVGPFVNHDGAGFDKAFRAEDARRTSEVFNGRSDLPVRWQEAGWPGVIFDVEPMFKTGPGVLYLWARVRFAKDGLYRMVCAAPVGAIAWAGGRQIVRYHHTHTPIPRAILPYVGEFEARGEVEVLVKVLRNRDAIGPLVLYFLGENGRVAHPVELGAMPA
jgi:hypothetical protein